MSMPGAYGPSDGSHGATCVECGADVDGWPDYDDEGRDVTLCAACADEDDEDEEDRKAWDEDEADMSRIAREWAEYDRDPPGS